MQLRLHFDHPHGHPNQIYTMRGYTLRIGRESEGVDFTVPDPRISRYHARITFDAPGERFLLEDEKSTHGTYINGRLLDVGEVAVLQPGDVIQLGNTEFGIEIVKSAPRQTNNDPDQVEDGTIRTRILVTDSRSHIIESAPDTGKYLEMVVGLQSALSNIPDLEEAVTTILHGLADLIPGMEAGGVLLKSEKNGEIRLVAGVPDPVTTAYSRTLAREALDNSEAVIWQHDTNQPTRSLVENQTAWAVYTPLLADDAVHGVLFIQNQSPLKGFTPDDANFVAAVAYFIAAHLTLRRRQMTLANLERQFSPRVAARLLTNDRVALGGESAQPVTVLMTDVRGFTRRCAEMDPHDVMNTVIDMFSRLTPIVFKYGGTVDKYVGDALLAVFGCPEADPDQAQHAVCAALEMQAAMDGHVFPIGVGIHMGEVMHGFIGSNDRMEYTVIGSTVNRAARFCDAAQAGQVVVSEAVLAALGDAAEVVALEPVPTKHPGLEPDVEGYLITAFDC